MRAVDVFEELGRCIAPFDLQKIDNALTDQPSQFDADARWHTHTDGWPHTTADRVVFDGESHEASAAVAGVDGGPVAGSLVYVAALPAWHH